MSSAGKLVDVDMEDKQRVQLLDAENNKLYTIYLSPEDAEMAKNGNVFYKYLLI